jgi:hypothetical protein
MHCNHAGWTPMVAKVESKKILKQYATIRHFNLFSQYLLVTFASVYYFVIEFIIPSTASALKLRSKLNSSKLFESNTVHALAESKCLVKFNALYRTKPNG